MYATYSTAAIRAAEAPLIADPSDLSLMRRAATGLAVAVSNELRRRTGKVSGRTVLLLVGSGNNGGDALFAGAWLSRRGVRVWWCPVMDRFHDAAAEACRRRGGRMLRLDEVSPLIGRCDLIIDGVVGIGGRPGLADSLTVVRDTITSSRVPVVAVDVPSGIDADTSATEPGTYLPADLTVTFGARKLCHELQPAAQACGRVELVDIGLELGEPLLRCWEPADVFERWPVPGPLSHKYTRGVVGVDAGSRRYRGAGLLSTLGAVNTGAGMVRFLGDEDVAQQVISQSPNVVAEHGRIDAAVVGSGWGPRRDGYLTVLRFLTSDIPLVVDADGLRYIHAGPMGHRVVLTPHAGELARLLGCTREQVESDPVSSIRQAVETTGATVLLKGATQLVAGPDSRVIDKAVPGPAWTAQAGSGDVLAGMIATLLAAGIPPREAAVMGASLQAIVAATHPGPVPPQNLAASIGDVIGRAVSQLRGARRDVRR